MKALKANAVMTGFVLSLACGTAFAAERLDVGKKEYESKCAVCHGVNGKGGGPYVEMLKRAPTDLTTLAAKNGGVFPMARVYEVIDGRAGVAAHGDRDMPVWGRVYAIRAAEYYGEVEYDERAFVRGRILSLIDYLYRLQAK